MLQAGLFVAALSFLTAPAVVAAANSRAVDDPYLLELTERARGLRLAEHSSWRALLHYRTPRFGKPYSEADEPDFFLAADGRRDAVAELEATLASFFAPPDAVGRDGHHPQCTFIARYRWLRTQLAMDPQRLPEQPCAAFEAWRAAIAPESLTLVFPEAYMNNPSSMFGHTLLRFDTVAGGSKRDLLAYAANFAASTEDDGAVAFAWKGIFGYYPGFLSLMPYYEKVREYGDWEQRDLWEFELDLTKDEIERLLEHLWELRGINFFYYFFDENCSYRLLRILEVARPGLRLSPRFRTWAIPADTVRAVTQDAGMLRSVGFRPSATTELRHQARALTGEQRRLALDLARGRRDPVGEEVRGLAVADRAMVLTVAHDVARHDYLTRASTREEALPRVRRILITRSEIPAAEAPPAVAVPRPDVRPDEGHRTARASLTGGVRRDRPFVELGARPAFHDLLDPQGGYAAGAQIDFLHMNLRVYADDGEVRLHRLTLVDIVSLAARDDILKPISWRVDTGAASLLVPGAGDSGIPGLAERYAWHSRGGAGVAYDAPLHGLAYAFADAVVDVGGGLKNSHALGLGTEFGLFLRSADDRVAVRLHGTGREFLTGSTRTALQSGVEQRFSLGKRHALRAGIAWQRDFGRAWWEGMVGWHSYL